MEKNEPIQVALKGNLSLLNVLGRRNLEEERDHLRYFEETEHALVDLRKKGFDLVRRGIAPSSAVVMEGEGEHEIQVLDFLDAGEIMSEVDLVEVVVGCHLLELKGVEEESEHFDLVTTK